LLSSPAKGSRHSSVCMVVFAHYPEDVRVRYEAEALVGAGMPVDVICLRQGSELPRERVNGVMVHRIGLERKRRGKIGYIWEYVIFIAAVALLLARLDARRGYGLIHVHNMPDVLVLCAIVPKIRGAKMLLDLHDPMPELFRTIYSVPEGHPVIRVLKVLEGFSIRLADAVITPNISFRKLFIARGCPPEKIHIVMNSPQETIFDRDAARTFREADRGLRGYALMLHGTVEERQGQDIAVRAVSLLRDRIPNLALHIYGEGSFLMHVRELVRTLRLDELVHFHGTVAIERIVESLARADVVLVPNKRNPFTELNFPTRIFEALRMEKPVIAPRTQGVLDYFDEGSLFFFEPGSAEDLAEKIVDIYSNPVRSREVVERGVEVYLRHTWERQGERLVALVGGLSEVCGA
jgi:glycosyltransferase involved in cell wall biosynthesis